MKRYRALAALFAVLLFASCSDSSSVSSDSPDPPDSGVDPQTPDDDETSRPNGLVINELVIGVFSTTSQAAAAGLNRDETGRNQPWFELFNGSGGRVDLAGYTLRTRGVLDATWTFPSVELGDGEFLRVWGTGQDRVADRNALHSGIPIMGSDEISLLHPDGSVVDQVADIGNTRSRSWGRYPDGSAQVGYFDLPSPGRANASGGFPFTLNCEYLTLSAGEPFQLRTSPVWPVDWTSSNPAVVVDTTGRITTTATGAARNTVRSVVTARDSAGRSMQCDVTVVNWTANQSRLAVVGYPQGNFLLRYLNDSIHFSEPGSLFKADEGFRRTERVGPFPPTPTPPNLLQTPGAYFVSSGSDIHMSQALQSWATSFTMRHRPLQHGFASYDDPNSGLTYLFAGDYSTDSNAPHSVYRGISSGSNTEWEQVLSFKAERQVDAGDLSAIRHVHVVTVDPYTGHVWVGTGDYDHHSRLYVSEDLGETFNLVAIGSQKFRTLSIWFTEGYVYWNMDSERADQKVHRLSRSVFAMRGTWPSLTPELSTGTTVAGVRYLVSSTRGGNFPVSTGRVFVESAPRALSAAERVHAVDDPQFDYSELVADLTHAAQWYHLWVKDQNGEDVLLMATNTEGSDDRLRDYNSRVFGFKERPDGTVDVQEVLNFPSRTPGQPNRYNQLIPNLQDDEGYIYMRGRETQRRLYQMRLLWNDQPG